MKKPGPKLHALRLIKRLPSSILVIILVTGHLGAKDRRYLYARTVYSRGQWTNGELAKWGKLCFHFLSTMTSGDFFEGLEWRKTESGDQFRRKGKVVAQFPDEVQIDVGFHTLPCSGNTPDEHLVLADLDNLLSSLKIEASWKRGMESRPVEVISPLQLVKPKNFKGHIIWGYKFSVQARGVPLTDVFVITASAPERKFLGRVAIDLTSPPVVSPFR